MSTVRAESPSSHGFVIIPSPNQQPALPSSSSSGSTLRLRPRDAVINTSSFSNSSLSTRPRGRSFSHRSRGSESNNSELEALDEELEVSDNELTPTIARTRNTRITGFQPERAKSPPPLVWSLKDGMASSLKLETVLDPDSLRRTATQSLPRSRGVTTVVRPSMNKYATISGGSSSRRRGILPDVNPGYHDSSTSTNRPINRQLSSPPARLPGASLPPAVPSNSVVVLPGRRRSSSQPSLPGPTGGPPLSRTSSHRVSLPVAPPDPPTTTILKPYRLMDLLCTTMASKSGGYITGRLHVPNEVWSQTGVKLSNLPEKIRVVEILTSGLEDVQIASQIFLANKEKNNNSPSFFAFPARSDNDDTERWLNKLDDWNAVCDSVLTSFGRKLGVGEGFVTKKNAGAGVPFWKVGRSTNLDSLAIYVSGLVKLFRLAQTLGEHTKALFPAHQPPLYTSLPPEMHHALEVRLKRSSEFFSNVVLMFVVRDLYLLLDKYVRKGEKWLAE